MVESKHVQFDESNYPGLYFLKKNGILDSDASDFEQDSSHELWEPDANAGNDSTTIESELLEVASMDEEVSTESSLSLSEDEAPLQNVTDVPSVIKSESELDSGNEADIEELTYYPEKESSFRENSEDEEFFTAKADKNGRPQRTRKQPERFSPHARAANLHITTSDKPTLSEAMNATEPEKALWIKAIEKELSSLEEKGTWSQEDKIPSNASILPSFLVLQIMRKSDGLVERFKARLVANGHSQKNKDFSATSTPVLDFRVVMFFINYILKTGMKHRHIDVETVRIRSRVDLFLVLFVKAHVSEWTRLWYGKLLLGDHWISIQEIGVRSNTNDAKRQRSE